MFRKVGEKMFFGCGFGGNFGEKGVICGENRDVTPLGFTLRAEAY
jgi:hypothetical protein